HAWRRGRSGSYSSNTKGKNMDADRQAGCSAFRRLAFLADGPAFSYLLNVLRREGNLARGPAHVHGYGADFPPCLDSEIRQGVYVAANGDDKTVHGVSHAVGLLVDRLLYALEQALQFGQIELGVILDGH